MNTALALTWATFSRSADRAHRDGAGGRVRARLRDRRRRARPVGRDHRPLRRQVRAVRSRDVRRRIVAAAWSDSHGGHGAGRGLCRGLAVRPRVGGQDDRLAVLPARLAHRRSRGPRSRSPVAWVLACVTVAVGAAALAIAVVDAVAPRRVATWRALGLDWAAGTMMGLLGIPFGWVAIVTRGYLGALGRDHRRYSSEPDSCWHRRGAVGAVRRAGPVGRRRRR